MQKSLYLSCHIKHLNAVKDNQPIYRLRLRTNVHYRGHKWVGWVSGGHIKVLFLCKCKNEMKLALLPPQRITMGCLGCRPSVWGSIVLTNGCLRGLCVSDLTFDNSHWSVMEKIMFVPMVYACGDVRPPCPPLQSHSHPFIDIYLFILRGGRGGKSAPP